MPDVSGPGGSTPAAPPYLPPSAALDGWQDLTAAEATLEPEPRGAPGRMGFYLAVHAGVYEH